MASLVPEDPSPAGAKSREVEAGRISTGNEDADLILGGGYLQNTVNVIMGSPGTGKTVFAQQMCFCNATGNRPIFYLTTLSEPLGKLLRFLQRYTFFDMERFGNRIIYEDLGSAISEAGPGGLVEGVEQLLLEHRPKIIVIDSFKAVLDLIEGLPEKRQFMHALAGLLTAYDTTTFLVGEYQHEVDAGAPEFSVADSIIEFLRQSSGSRDVRYCRVLKLRGSNYHTGLHAMSVSAEGASFFPRLVTPSSPPIYAEMQERISTGIGVLDEMMMGGLWRGTTSLVMGPTGSGKTTLGLQFLQEGAQKGESGLYLYFQENPTQLQRRFLSIGHALSEEQRSLLELMYRSPVEMQVDSIIGSAFRTIEKNQIRRVVVDSVGDLAHATDDWQRLQDYLYSLAQYFIGRGITSLLMMEGNLAAALSDNQSPHTRLSPLADNLILLHVDGTHDSQAPLTRSIRIMKMRNSAHSMQPASFVIDAEGMRHV